MKAALAQGQANVATVVRENRRRHDMTQAALARRMVELGHESWRQTTVAKVESERAERSRPLSLAEAVSLAYLLGLPRLEALFGESEVGMVLARRYGEVLRSTVTSAIGASIDVLRKTDIPGAETLADSLSEHMARIEQVVYSADDVNDLDEIREAVDNMTGTFLRQARDRLEGGEG